MGPALLAHACDARSAFPSITNRLAATRHWDGGPAGQAGAQGDDRDPVGPAQQAAASRLGGGGERLGNGSIIRIRTRCQS